MLWHLVWIFAVLIMLSTSYIITFHFTPVMELWQSSRSFDHFRTELNTTISIDSQVNHELNTVLRSAHAGRAYVFRYHNGIPSVNGVPFMFQTNTHEVIRPGVNRVIASMQRLPSSINSQMTAEFTKNACVVLNHLDQNPDGSNHWFYESRNAHAMIRCAIYKNQGDLLGFVGVDFVEPTTDAELAAAHPSVLAASQIIARIFDTRR